MPKVDLFDPVNMRTWVGRLEKEELSRVQFLEKNYDKLVQFSTQKPGAKLRTQEDIIKIACEHQMGAITNGFLSSTPNRFKTICIEGPTKGIEAIVHEHDIQDPKVGLGDPKEDPRLTRPDTDLSLDPIMRPVDPKVKKTIYDPAIKGSEPYLKKRAEIPPDERYYFPETTSFNYGWRLQENKYRFKSRYALPSNTLTTDNARLRFEHYQTTKLDQKTLECP